jgi:branched-chain amino acid transport system substrate-binding protein
MKVIAQSMNEIKSIDPTKVVEHLESGAKFDVFKSREGYFRAADHQLMQEMFAITALPAGQAKNAYDIFSASAALPAAGESLETMAAGPEENVCRFPA